MTLRVMGGERWRIARGLPTHRNDYGPLTDRPDWSYADGTPGKLGKGQITRIKKNEEMAKRVLEQLTELDAAIGLQQKEAAEKETNTMRLAQQKLKSKSDNPSSDYRRSVSKGERQ